MERIKAFISFCGADRELAQRLQRDLATAGCASWQFDISAIPGTDAWEAILQRIEQSDFFLVLLSEAASQSRGVTEEISHAHYCSLNSPSGVPRIIPLLLQGGVTVPRKIVRAVRLQFRGDTYDNDFALLLRSLGIEPSPFQTATGLEASSTRSYEFEAEREAARNMPRDDRQPGHSRLTPWAGYSSAIRVGDRGRSTARRPLSATPGPGSA